MTVNTPSTTTLVEDWLKLPAFPYRRNAHDPLANLIGGRERDLTEQTPMVKLDFDVTIRGGLALVKTTRTYVNKSDGPIEAVMSLPVPVQAAFFGLSAVIDGKRYEANAMAKVEARETYEDALDEGKAAVLHEELLRGVHSLSVGNLGAGHTVEVTMHWAELVRFHGDSGQLRIPLTVGDVYGVSPLEDVDTLETGGPIPEATLRVRHDGAGVTVNGEHIQPDEEGSLFTHVPGNAPIELSVTGLRASTLTGLAADQRHVTLKIKPESVANSPLNAAILVDRSGSMGSECDYLSTTELSIHQAVVRGLEQLGPDLISEDRLVLWEFDTACDPVGTGQSDSPEAFNSRVAKLGEPRGGTSIGSALETVFKAEPERDVLLITDGQSYSLDVEKLVRAGRRVFVVLVGEGSLEALVGHLAALSGGDLHYSFGSDVGSAIAASIQGMRQRRVDHAICEFDDSDAPVRVRNSRGNALVEISWSEAKAEGSNQDLFSRAVAAYAASLAFAGADEEKAAILAQAEGLVTHLTSLVLVVEQGPTEEALAKTVKVLLPSPRTRSHDPSLIAYSPARSDRRCYAQPPSFRKSSAALGLGPVEGFIGKNPFSSLPPQRTEPGVMYSSPGPVDPGDLIREVLDFLGQNIDWNTFGPQLAEGNLEGLPEEITDLIRDLAVDLERLADLIGLSKLMTAIALAAFTGAHHSRWAKRVYRRITKGVDTDLIEEFADLL